METLSFAIAAEPTPASRPRVTKQGVTFYPKKHTLYAETLKRFFQTVEPMKTAGPMEVRLMFVMPPYKTSESPVHRSDVDNLAKLPLDVMTKSKMDDDETPRFWVDDNLVVHLTAMKRFARVGEQPHTKVRVKAVEGNIEDYIDRMFDA